MEEENMSTINAVVKKKPITREYYQIWAQDMDLLITSNSLDSYIYEENFKIISCKDDDCNDMSIVTS